MTKAEKWESIISPHLVQGEIVHYAVMGAVGKVSAKRQIATATITALVSLGTLVAVSRPNPVGIVLTNKRLLFLEASANAGKPRKKLVGSIPLGSFTVQPVSSLLLRKFDLFLHDGSTLRLTFPISKKSAADELAKMMSSDNKFPINPISN